MNVICIDIIFYLLYKAEKPSVRLFVTSIALLFLRGSMSDEHDVIPTFPGISMLLCESL